MRRPASPKGAIDDATRVAALLETLRGTSLSLDVEAAVFRRVRALPLSRSAAHAWPPPPRVSLRQFAWGAFSAIMAGACGALGLLVLIGYSGSPGAPQMIRTAQTMLRSLFSAALAQILFVGEHALALRPWVDAALGAAGQAALLVCAAMVALTLLVVAREARSRRAAG